MNRNISMELTADSARVTSLKLDGGRLVLTIEAQLADSQVIATGIDAPAAGVAEAAPAPAMSAPVAVVAPAPVQPAPAPSSPAGLFAPGISESGAEAISLFETVPASRPAPVTPPAPPAPPAAAIPAAAAPVPPLSVPGIMMPEPESAVFEQEAEPVAAPAPMPAFEQPAPLSLDAFAPVPEVFAPQIEEVVEETAPQPFVAPSFETGFAASEESNVFGGARHGEPQSAISFGPELLAPQEPATPQPQPAPMPMPGISLGAAFEPVPAPGPVAPAPAPGPAVQPAPAPAPVPAPAPAPEEQPKPETGGTTVLIRYTCPKCKTQGMQAVDKVGTVVNCSNCGKAMRLVMKK